jgi:hypothetical protein
MAPIVATFSGRNLGPKSLRSELLEVLDPICWWLELFRVVDYDFLLALPLTRPIYFWRARKH